MKSIAKILVFVFLVTACKSNTKIINTNTASLKKLSSRKIIKNHIDNSFKAKTLDARLSVDYSDNRKDGRRKRQSLTVRLRIKKDSVIWIKGSKLISAFRAKITPDSFSYYSPISKEYFTGDYEFLKKILGVEITFNQLQNLFFGQSLWNLKEQKYISSIDQKSHKLTPKKQNELYSIFFFFHASNFRLKKQLMYDKNDKTLTISYPGYILKEKEFFPKRITINASEKDYFTFVSLAVRSLEINKPISMPYRIPAGYKKLEITE